MRHVLHPDTLRAPCANTLPRSSDALRLAHLAGGGNNQANDDCNMRLRAVLGRRTTPIPMPVELPALLFSNSVTPPLMRFCALVILLVWAVADTAAQPLAEVLLGLDITKRLAFEHHERLLLMSTSINLSAMLSSSAFWPFQDVLFQNVTPPASF